LNGEIMSPMTYSGASCSSAASRKAGVDSRRLCAHHGFDQQRVLRHREDMRAAGLPVPARDPRQPMGDVGDFDVERRGVEQIEPAPR